MKKLSKLAVIVLAVFMALTSLVGCGVKVTDEETSLEIELYKAGYGEEFLTKLADAYMKKNPLVDVFINSSSEDSLIRTHLPSGPNNNTVDLYFQGDSYFDIMSETGGVTYQGVKYENKLADLTDVYNAKIDGENITVKEKMFPDYANYHNVGTDGKDKFYQYPWAAGIGGLTYNYNLFKKYGWKIPNTTDELFALCQKISDAKLKYNEKDIYPFLFCLEDSYWDMAFLTWWAQYDGIEAYNKFWQGEYYDAESGSYKFGAKMMLTEGKYETLKIMDRILCIDKSKSEWTLDSAYTDKESVNSFMQVQTKYFEGGAAMMPNGDWLENEVRTDFEAELASGELDIRFMPLPIISSLGTKLAITDSELSSAVNYIRNGGDKPKLSDEIIASVQKACNINQTLGTNHNAVIPCYAKGAKVAKDFLVFMASDEAQQIYLEATKGCMLPFKFDATKIDAYNKFTNFQKTKLALMSNSNFVFNQSKHPLFYKGGVSPFSNLKTSMEVYLFNEKNYVNAKTINMQNYDYVYKNWEDILRNSGIGL